VRVSDSVFGVRYPALGHGGIRGEGDATFPHASSKPRAEHRIRCPVPPLGPRYPAFGVGSTPVPGIRSQVPGPAPGTWYRTLKGRPGYRRDSRFMFQKTRIRGLHPTSCILYPASCIPHVRVFRRQVAGARCQVPGTWHLGPGTGSTPRAGYRAPKTESEGQVPENAHTGFASCI